MLGYYIRLILLLGHIRLQNERSVNKDANFAIIPSHILEEKHRYHRWNIDK